MQHGSLDIALVLGAAFLIACVFASKLSSIVGVPTLIVFIGVGMLAGSEGPGGLAFENFALTQQLGSILLGFILFAGGMDTDWKQLKPVLWRGISLSTVGVIATTLMVGAFGHYVLGLSPMEGFLLGAIISSTDAAAVFSVLRGKGLALKNGLGPLVEIESGTNDPMAVFLTAGLTELVRRPDMSPWSLIPSLLQQMPIGLAVGIGLGIAAVWTINHIRLDYDGLYPVVTLATAAGAYGAAPLIGGNAFIAVYAAGVVLGSSIFVHKISLTQFHDGIAWLLQIAVFLALGLLVFPSQILPAVGAGLALAAFLTFFARPASVLLSLAMAKMRKRSKLFVAWAGLRGAFPIILGTYPVLAGLQNGHFIFNLVFFVVVASVLLQGTTLRMVAKWTDVVVEKHDPHDLKSASHSEIVEITLDPSSPATRKQVVELGLPTTALLVLLRRGGENYIPRGATILHAGDTLVVATRREDHDELRLRLGGPASMMDDEEESGS